MAWRWMLVLVAGAALGAEPAKDWRDLASGTPIPTPGMKYVDQLYVVKMKDGRWLCMLTVGTLGEVARGSENYSAIMFSVDQGKNWSAPLRCNTAYAVPLIGPADCIYSLTPTRYTWSDDGGRTWGGPLSIDAFKDAPENGPGHEGNGWTVTLPVVREGSVYIPFARIGLAKPPRRTDVFFLRSDNILTEMDPKLVRWQRLPDGATGLRGPDWDRPQNRSEEPHAVVLSDGSLYCVWRTDQGGIGQSTSRDGGKTWSKPGYVTFADGRRIKHPLACSSLWKCANGKYLLWHHNHDISPKNHYAERNPAWISGGVEVDAAEGRTIRWSEPEVFLYSDDRTYDSGRISYPGLLEDRGQFFLFETQKTQARWHAIDPRLLDAVWRQHELREIARDGLLAELRPPKSGSEMPRLPSVAGGGGFTIEVVLKLDRLDDGQMLIDTRDDAGKGIAVDVQGRAVRLRMSDGVNKAEWGCDAGLIAAGGLHHLAFIADGGPKILSVVVDGRLCDGGSDRRYGWTHLGEYNAQARQLEGVPGNVGGSRLRTSPQVQLLRIYGRALLTSDAVGNARAERQAK